MFIPVEGNSNLVRNSATNAIVNVNSSEYNAYINNRKKKLKESEKIDQIESDLISIKDQISEIKDLLRRIAND
jgi:hypothetical protein